MKGNFFKSRKFKYGSVATAVTAVVIALVVIANVIFTLLSDAYSWKVDITSYDLYSISDSSKQIVDSLTQNDITINMTVMYSEEEYPAEFKEMVKRFANLSNKIHLSFVDPVVNPTALKAYGAEYNIEEGSIVVENGNRRRIISFEDMYEADSSTGAVTYKTEQCLASAVLYVTKEEVPLVYFINGHGEAGYESLMSLLANNGADVEEVKLSQLTEYDPLARLMVICGPTMDYSEGEIRKLQEFLANDYNYERDLMFFSNPEIESLANLDAFLADWGMKLNNDIVLESDSYSASSYASDGVSGPLYLIPSYSEAEVSGVQITADYLSVVPNARSITLLFESQDITETGALLTTSAESYAKSADGVHASYDQASDDAKGPFNVATIATRYKFLNNVAVESHVFLAGSVDILNQTLMTYNGNNNFIYNVYKMMVNETEAEILDANKAAGSTMMTLTTSAVRWASIIFVGVIPAIFLILGLIVYFRRRYL